MIQPSEGEPGSKSVDGIYQEMAFLDAVCNYGSGVVTFFVVGLTPLVCDIYRELGRAAQYWCGCANSAHSTHRSHRSRRSHRGKTASGDTGADSGVDDGSDGDGDGGDGDGVNGVSDSVHASRRACHGDGRTTRSKKEESIDMNDDDSIAQWEGSSAVLQFHTWQGAENTSEHTYRPKSE